MTLIRTRETIYSVRDLGDVKATTADVQLTHPVAGATTQEDANKIIDERLTKLETEIDGGQF